ASLLDSSLLQFFNSTLSANFAERYGGGIIAGFGSEVHLFGSTVTNNDAQQAGGGVFLDALAHLVMDSTIIAGNAAQGTAADIRQSGATIATNFSFVGDAFGSNLAPALPDSNGNFIGHSQSGTIDAQLGPLSDNGGVTLTHRPLASSPAIDNGNPIPPGVEPFDQIGNARVANGRMDIGAVEVLPPGPPCDFNLDGDCDVDDIDAMIEAIAAATNDLTFDLTDDGIVNLADRDQWLTDAGALNLISGNPYLLGDANLDGAVDGNDFIIWNDHKFSATGKWSEADWNADGLTDGVDFVIWNGDKFTSSDTLHPISADQLPAAPVIEPIEWIFAKSDQRASTRGRAPKGIFNEELTADPDWLRL
ncbi:MAG: choice-of-anchor Q domain-containing protein, partial [Planctomycetota bacterium]